MKRQARPLWQRAVERAARKRLLAALKSVEAAPVTEATYLNLFNTGVMVHLPTLRRTAAKALRQYLQQ